jgi:3-methyladenine DNA glycosylase AlkD
MPKLGDLNKELKQKANPKKAKDLMRFFKTGMGEYGEGDIFLGIMVPESRKLAKKYSDLPLKEISKLIKSKYHEARLVALLILVHNYKNIDKSNKLCSAEVKPLQKEIYEFYLAHTKYINNWDLVDLSAGYIVGDYLSRKQGFRNLEKLAKSKNIWERRIAIIATFAFIYKGEYEPTFHIVKMLLNDPEDLIHKACGWMLREVGKRVSEPKLRAFLNQYGPQMPRTMLRYAIERLPEKMRKIYLSR